MTPTYGWLLLGVVLVAVEAFAIPGIGFFFFAGFGALSLSLLLAGGIVGEEAWIAQLAWFCACSAGWALLLWKPLKRWKTSKHSGEAYHNIIGHKALIVGALEKGKTGTVRWSGTLMQARLAAESEASMLQEGTEVIITAVEGTTLTVKPA